MISDSVRALYRVFLLFYATCALALYFILQDTSVTPTFRTAVDAASLAVAPALMVVAFFDRIGWRIRIVRWAFRISRPSISGRWTGFIKSSYSNHSVEHPIVLEIWQTYSSIHVWYFDENAVTSTLLAGFERLESESLFRLLVVYSNRPVRTDQRSLQAHVGVMDLNVSLSSRTLYGTYFNNPRERRTYGELRAVWQSRRRFGAFEEHGD